MFNFLFFAPWRDRGPSCMAERPVQVDDGTLALGMGFCIACCNQGNTRSGIGMKVITDDLPCWHSRVFFGAASTSLSLWALGFCLCAYAQDLVKKSLAGLYLQLADRIHRDV